jgi:transposase-like protein
MAEDYPRTLLDFESRFGSDEACRQYLAKLRWPEGFSCPRCRGREVWPASRGRLVCAACRHQTSVIAGTIFQSTRLPLRLWFRAMWHMTSQKQGASAIGLQRVLGLGSYLTAWTWLHKLRRAMVRPGRDRLRGRVEVDETFLGSDDTGQIGRRMLKKMLVVIAAEEDGQGIGRIRLARIPDASGASLTGFVSQVVELDATVHTDGWEGYAPLRRQGYRHELSILKGKGPQAAVRLLPRVHRVASLLQRWLLGTHQGAVSPQHLDYYLDEFTFRFNRRKSASRGKLFFRLCQQAVQVDPAPYATIVGGKSRRA